MRFIYDTKDETLIEYDPVERLKFIANDPRSSYKPSKPGRVKVTTFHFLDTGALSHKTVSYREDTNRY